MDDPGRQFAKKEFLIKTQAELKMSVSFSNARVHDLDHVEGSPGGVEGLGRLSFIAGEKFNGDLGKQRVVEAGEDFGFKILFENSE